MITERRFAVIIGINDYDYSPLDYCVKDALDVASILEAKCKFQKNDIHLITSDLINPIKDVSGHFETAIKVIEKDFEKDKDSIFFYFAGHGEYSFNQSGLLFQDTLTEISDVFNRINILQPKYQCYVIDACESGGKVLTRGKKDIDLIEEFISKSSGILFMYAATEKQSASESGKMSHGIFTYYFLDAINNKENYDTDGILTPNRIQDYIARETIKETKFKQTPVIENRTVGYYPFAFDLSAKKSVNKSKQKQGKKRSDKENNNVSPKKKGSSIDRQYFPEIPVEIRRVILLELQDSIDEVLEKWHNQLNDKVYEQKNGTELSIFRSSSIQKLTDEIVTEAQASTAPPVGDLFSSRKIEIPSYANHFLGNSMLASMLKKEPPKYEFIKDITWNADRILCRSFIFDSKDIFKVSFGVVIVVYQSIYGIGLIFLSFHYNFDGYRDSSIIGLKSNVKAFKVNPNTTDEVSDTISSHLSILKSSIEKWNSSRKADIEKFDTNSS